MRFGFRRKLRIVPRFLGRIRLSELFHQLRELFVIVEVSGAYFLKTLFQLPARLAQRLELLSCLAQLLLFQLQSLPGLVVQPGNLLQFRAALVMCGLRLIKKFFQFRSFHDFWRRKSEQNNYCNTNDRRQLRQRKSSSLCNL